MNILLLLFSIVVCIIVYFFLIYRPGGPGAADGQDDSPQPPSAAESPKPVPKPTGEAGKRRSAFDDILSGKAVADPQSRTGGTHARPRKKSAQQAAEELRSLREFARKGRYDDEKAAADEKEKAADDKADIWDSIGSDEVPEVDASSRFLSDDDLNGLSQLKDVEYEMYVQDTEAEQDGGSQETELEGLSEDGSGDGLPYGVDGLPDDFNPAEVLPPPGMKEEIQSRADWALDATSRQADTASSERPVAVHASSERGSRVQAAEVSSFSQQDSPTQVSRDVHAVPPIPRVDKGMAVRTELPVSETPVTKRGAVGRDNAPAAPSDRADQVATQGLQARMGRKPVKTKSACSKSLFEGGEFAEKLKQCGPNLVGPDGKRLSPVTDAVSPADASSPALSEPKADKGGQQSGSGSLLDPANPAPALQAPPFVPEPSSLWGTAERQPVVAGAASVAPTGRSQAVPSAEMGVSRPSAAPKRPAERVGGVSSVVPPSSSSVLFTELVGRRWTFRSGGEMRFSSSVRFSQWVDRIFRVRPDSTDTMATRGCHCWTDHMAQEDLSRSLGDSLQRLPIRTRLYRSCCREAFPSEVLPSGGLNPTAGNGQAAGASVVLCHRRLDLVLPEGESVTLSDGVRSGLFRWCRDWGMSLPGGAVLKACIEHADRPYHVHLVYTLPRVPEG